MQLNKKKHETKLYLIYDPQSSHSRQMLEYVYPKLISKTPDVKPLAIDQTPNELIAIMKNGTKGILLLLSTRLIKQFILLFISARINRIPTLMLYNEELPTKYRYLTHLRNIHQFNQRTVLKDIEQVITERINAYAEFICNTNYLKLNTQYDTINMAYHTLQGTTPQKRTLIFIHGVTANCFTYKKLLKLVSNYFDIICIDLPGHGMSSEANISNLNDLGDIVYLAVKQIIKRNNITAPIIMGHSLGGGIAWYVSHKLESDGQTLYKTILLNPAGLPIDNSKAILFLKGVLVRARSFKFYLQQRKDVLDVLTDQILFYIRKGIDEGLIKIGIRKLLNIVPPGFQLQPHHILKTPTLLIFSEKDPFFGPEYRLRFMQLLQCAQYIEVQGGHEWPVLVPEGIEPFLRNVMKGRTTK